MAKKRGNVFLSIRLLNREMKIFKTAGFPLMNRQHLPMMFSNFYHFLDKKRQVERTNAPCIAWKGEIVRFCLDESLHFRSVGHPVSKTWSKEGGTMCQSKGFSSMNNLPVRWCGSLSLRKHHLVYFFAANKILSVSVQFFIFLVFFPTGSCAKDKSAQHYNSSIGSGALDVSRGVSCPCRSAVVGRMNLHGHFLGRKTKWRNSRQGWLRKCE